MKQKAMTDVAPATSPLPGAPTIARIRRLVISAAIATLVYSIFTRATRSLCQGGFDAGGSFIDAAGQPTETAPVCVNLVLSPSGVIYFAIVIIVISALTRALRASDHNAAAKPIDRAAAIIGIVVAVSIVASQIWFALIPLSEYGNGFLIFPFPFGAVELTVTPMTTGV